MFLTPEELSQLTGYQPQQRARTRRWLEQNGIPYTTNRLGDAVVLRSDVDTPRTERAEPKLEWLKKSA